MSTYVQAFSVGGSVVFQTTPQEPLPNKAYSLRHHGGVALGEEVAGGEGGGLGHGMAGGGGPQVNLQC